MRYWIWWNDLIQGPFELDELTSLKAFSEDLLVCMEDRDEWIPASRVADLSSAVEQLRDRRAVPRVPPPPPPKRRPTMTPLQGEFFSDSPGQEQLIDPEEGPKGPFAYYPVGMKSENLPWGTLESRVTMPFHFARQPGTSVAVIELPRAEPPQTVSRPAAIVKESPVPIEESAPVPLEVLREAVVPELADAPAEDKMPEPAIESRSSFTLPLLDVSYEDKYDEKKLAWLPWILGVALAIGSVSGLGYWLIDRASSHAAVTEAQRMETPRSVAGARNPSSDQAARALPDLPHSTLAPESQATNASSTFSNLLARARAMFTKTSSANETLTKATGSAPGPSTAESLESAPGSAGGIPTTKGRSGLLTVPGKVARYAMAKSKRAAASAKRRLAAHHLSHKNRTPSQTASAVAAATAVSPTAVSPAAPSPAEAIPVLPGVLPPAAPAPAAESTPATPHSPSAISEPVSAGAASSAPNPWKGKQSSAVALVQNKALPKSKFTVGNQARTMLQDMHEKELIHAAETGERLYLPDKISWTALQEEGSHYRVYLNFLSWQANGERVQSRSYQFLVDLQRKEVSAADPSTQQDLLTQSIELTFKHNPMATDIESILGGVDTYNKHKVQLIIVKKSRRNRDDRKKIEAALSAAQARVQRAVVYFRRTYAEKALQNLSKAYEFSEMLKG